VVFHFIYHIFAAELTNFIEKLWGAKQEIFYKSQKCKYFVFYGCLPSAQSPVVSCDKNHENLMIEQNLNLETIIEKSSY